MNLTNILELTRAFVNKATNFTNKELFFNYLSLWFKSGALLLNPVNRSNDMVALNFSQVRISALIITITICSFEAANHAKSTQLNPPITELITISIVTITYPEKKTG